MLNEEGRPVPTLLTCTPDMSDVYRLEVPNGGQQAPTLAEGKGVNREVKSEGSREQTFDLRHTNPI